MLSDNAVHVAIELSSSTWLVAARLPGTDKSQLHRIDGGDTTKLLALLAELGQQRSARLARVNDVVCCFEAGAKSRCVYPRPRLSTRELRRRGHHRG